MSLLLAEDLCWLQKSPQLPELLGCIQEVILRPLHVKLLFEKILS